VALERLAEDPRGDLVYTCTKPWSDGTIGMTLSPLELLEKLAAVVPLPHVHHRRCTLTTIGPLESRHSNQMRLCVALSCGFVFRSLHSLHQSW
jgi:hypothetical protein